MIQLDVQLPPSHTPIFLPIFHQQHSYFFQATPPQTPRKKKDLVGQLQLLITTCNLIRNLFVSAGTRQNTLLYPVILNEVYEYYSIFTAEQPCDNKSKGQHPYLNDTYRLLKWTSRQEVSWKGSLITSCPKYSPHKDLKLKFL